MPVLTLNDLYVGQTFKSHSYTMSADEIKNYARQFDPQPFHLDEEAAKHSIFGGLVASGWHTASVSMRLIVESVHLNCGLIGLGGTINWLKPVHPETTIHVESEITAIIPSRSKAGQAVMTMRCAVKDSNDEALIEFTPKLMVFGG